MRLTYALALLAMALVGCAEAEPRNADGTTGMPGTNGWWRSATPEQRLAYHREECRARYGAQMESRQVESCARSLYQSRAEANYEHALLMAQLYAQTVPPPSPTININVDPGPVTCRQLGSFIRCD